MRTVHHVLSLSPHIAKGGNWYNYPTGKIELMTQLLSVLVWKKNNPQDCFKLYADTAGAKFLEKNGLICIYDEINTDALNDMSNINPVAFWAAGKIFAYDHAIRTNDQPIFIDTDAILWCPLDEFGFTGDVVAAHWESCFAEWYFEGNLNVPKGYNYPKFAEILKSKRFTQLNASFLWLKDAELTDMYLFEAFRFMKNNHVSNAFHLPNFAHMCYAEQVLLADVALHLNKKIETLGNNNSDYLGQRFTHLWGEKAVLRTENKRNNDSLAFCCGMIAREFPNYSELAERIRTDF
jgi:hypothetical protein